MVDSKVRGIIMLNKDYLLINGRVNQRILGDMFTLHMGTASVRGHSLCVLCKATQSTQSGCSSFSQYSSSGFRCRLQTASLSRFLIIPWCGYLTKAWQTSLRARLEIAWPSVKLSLHRGHMFPVNRLLFCRQSRQKLWVHGSIMGLLKMSRHTEHVSSCWRCGSFVSSSMARSRIFFFTLLSFWQESSNDERWEGKHTLCFLRACA